MTEQPNGASDFNPAKIATTVTKHDEEFISVKSRLDALEAKFGNNERIADTLCETAEKASKMNEMVGKRFLHLLQNDVGIKSEIANIINKTDRNYFMATMKRVGVLVATIIWSVIMLVIGAWISSSFK
jgi:putative Ca2+/H+ antiporter (TMEM165/GDT1 family)